MEMRVLHVPPRLRVSTALICFCVPLAALEVVISSRVPWWRLPYKVIGFWSLTAFLLSCPLCFWLLQGKKWAFQFFAAFGLTWVVASASMAMRFKHPPLGFFAIFLACYFGTLLYWLMNELKQTYFDPQLKWYQGLPKPIPGLRCRITLAGTKTREDFRVSRIDQQGVFVFSDRSVQEGFESPGSARLELSFRDREVICEGLPMVALTRGRAVGFRFQAMTPDLNKKLGDFVENLRGEGYVE